MQSATTLESKFEALGSLWWIQSDTSEKTHQRLEAIAVEFESIYTRFSDSSLIGQLNKTKRLLSPPHELIEMLEFAIDFSKETKGLFNPTVGGELNRLGYGKQDASKLEVNWAEKLEISDRELRIQGDFQIDLGGFGKGWLVDLLYNELLEEGAEFALVNGGGDIRVFSHENIDVPLMLPGNKTKKFATSSLKTGALASSSPLVRRWGEGNNHLITPQGTSYDGPVTQTTIYAPTCVEADAAATVCLLADQPGECALSLGLSCLFTTKDGAYYADQDFPLKR